MKILSVIGYEVRIGSWSDQAFVNTCEMQVFQEDDRSIIFEILKLFLDLQVRTDDHPHITKRLCLFARWSTCVFLRVSFHVMWSGNEMRVSFFKILEYRVRPIFSNSLQRVLWEYTNKIRKVWKNDWSCSMEMRVDHKSDLSSSQNSFDIFGLYPLLDNLSSWSSSS